MDSAEPQPPIPAQDAPHAYVAVRRTHSVNADRPEWEYPAYVIPEWDRERLDELRHFGFALLPIGPDGDIRTLAITESGNLVTKLAAIRALATQWATQPGATNSLMASSVGALWQIGDGRELLAILDGEAVRDGE